MLAEKLHCAGEKSCRLWQDVVLSLKGLFVLSTIRDTAALLTCPMPPAAPLGPAVAWAHPAPRSCLLRRALLEAGMVRAVKVMEQGWVVPEVTTLMRAVCQLSAVRATCRPVVAIGVIANGQN